MYETNRSVRGEDPRNYGRRLQRWRVSILTTSRHLGGVALQIQIQTRGPTTDEGQQTPMTHPLGHLRRHR